MYLQHSIVYYEQDGDDIYQFRVQTDLVSVPDSEILQVLHILITSCFINTFYAKLYFI